MWPDELTIINTSREAMTGDVLIPFAFDEAICQEVGRNLHPAVIHIWRHRKAFVIGLRDSKLPSASQAAEWLNNQGYMVGVRNSGGAAVPLDGGVVNVSLIMPRPHSDSAHFNINEGFEWMYQWIKSALERTPNVQVEKGEVAGSYCPGSYDLSIQGQKFCGIAQRRQTKAFIVQAFINVTDSGSDRARLVKQFYEQATYSSPEKALFPIVKPETVTSLEEKSVVDKAELLIESLISQIPINSSRTFTSNQIYFTDSVARFRKQIEERYGISR